MSWAGWQLVRNDDDGDIVESWDIEELTPKDVSRLKAGEIPRITFGQDVLVRRHVEPVRRYAELLREFRMIASALNASKMGVKK